MKNKIKVLVVDDSAFMRKSLSLMLESDEEIEVIATANDGVEGFEKAKSIRPDIITLDIEMPRMDGLTTLKKIMAECPTSVLMVSSLTSEGAEATLKALEYGAVDFIPKELSFVNINIIKIKEDLIHKVKEIVKQRSVKSRLERLRKLSGPQAAPLKPIIFKPVPSGIFRAVALGISTGGPFSLQKILPRLSKSINCPIFIVQHMPPKFTKSLAERLNSMCQLEVKEAENDETVRPGVIYIAPGGFHMTLRKNIHNNVQIVIAEEPSTTLHRPSVDVMMSSVVSMYGKNTLGIIMTGMGKDGYEAVIELKKIGGFCIAQDEESCVVYGMPKAINDAGLSDVVLPLEQIPEQVNKAFEYGRRI